MEGSVTAALLEEYSMSRSEAVRNEIVLKNLGLDAFLCAFPCGTPT